MRYDDHVALAVSLRPPTLTPAMATLIQSAILADHDDNPHALVRAHSTAGRLRFQLYSPTTPPPHIPSLVPAQYFAGAMAATNVTRIFAVVPRSSTLGRSNTLNHHAPSSADIPPPSPLRGGRGEGSAFVSGRVFFNTSSGCPRLPDERCRPIWTNRPPPAGEDGYVYPVGTASSVSWRVAHTHS